MRFDFFVKLKSVNQEQQCNHLVLIILCVTEICDVNYCARGAKLRYASYNVDDVIAPLIISPL